jgi:membrane protease YdiL (CAAX protease family)
MGLRARDLGLDPSGLRQHAWIYAAGYAIVLPLVVIVSFRPDFLETYPFYSDAAGSWRELLLWEGSYAVQFVALEYFFRGVLLFAAFRVLGPWAIPMMVVPYTMIHFGKPLPECVGAIIAGSALGIVALRTRAIYAGMVIHIGVAWTMDLLALWHEGELQELIGRTWTVQ